MKTDLTPERLREVLDYDPETGLFRWKNMRHVFVKPGDVAGTLEPRGYIRIGIDGEIHKAHRLAWLYVHGVWPAHYIDHINCIKDDNRIANLRDATDHINAQNIRTPNARNISGQIGVHRTTSRGKPWKWRARITIEGKRVLIGDFNTPEEAGAAYLAAKRKHHEGCTI